MCVRAHASYLTPAVARKSACLRSWIAPETGLAPVSNFVANSSRSALNTSRSVFWSSLSFSSKPLRSSVDSGASGLLSSVSSQTLVDPIAFAGERVFFLEAGVVSALVL